MAVEEEEEEEEEKEEERTQQDLRRNQIVLVNMMTQAMVILHGQQEVFEEHSTAVTILPAPAASIQSIKTVAPVPEEECSVCLDRFVDMAKEMPCGHRFHVGCIKRWLGLHGSCPLCRYQMPGTEVRKLHGANGIWVAISLGRGIIDRRRDHGVGPSA